MTTATIINLSDKSERVNLPQPHYIASACGEPEYTGVWITGLYSGPRTGRRFVRSHSIWQARNGGCVGTRIREVSESEYLDVCARVGADPAHATASEL